MTISIGEYRRKNRLTLDQLAERLGISKGHASDLCTGKQRPSVNIAMRMEKLTGKPWHTFIEVPAE